MQFQSDIGSQKHHSVSKLLIHIYIYIYTHAHQNHDRLSCNLSQFLPAQDQHFCLHVSFIKQSFHHQSGCQQSCIFFLGTIYYLFYPFTPGIGVGQLQKKFHFIRSIIHQLLILSFIFAQNIFLQCLFPLWLDNYRTLTINYPNLSKFLTTFLFRLYSSRNKVSCFDYVPLSERFQ